MPTCARCHQEKPADEFYSYSPSWCKACRREYEQGRRPPPKRLQLPPGVKRCPDCQRDLPVAEFRPRVAGGVHAYCRPCERIRNERSRRKTITHPRGPLGSEWAEWRTSERKWCPECEEFRPLAEFGWNKKYARPSSCCRRCDIARHGRWLRTPAGRAAQKRDMAKRWKTHKGAVRRFTQAAIALGILVRQPCEVCGERKVHAHHVDYAEPLNVRWLCKAHHVAVHRQRGEAP